MSVILIVDDDAGVRAVIADMITSLGEYEVVQAASALAAIELVNSGRKFDLLLIDLLMPDMSGEQLIRVLREGSDRPMFVVTGAARPPAIPEAAGLLRKPLHLADLEKVLSGLK